MLQLEVYIVYCKAYQRSSHQLVLWLMISTLLLSAVVALELVVTFQRESDIEIICKVIVIVSEYAIPMVWSSDAIHSCRYFHDDYHGICIMQESLL